MKLILSGEMRDDVLGVREVDLEDGRETAALTAVAIDDDDSEICKEEVKREKQSREREREREREC